MMRVAVIGPDCSRIIEINTNVLIPKSIFISCITKQETQLYLYETMAGTLVLHNDVTMLKLKLEMTA